MTAGREKHFELMQEEVVFLLEALEKRADRVEPNYLLKRQATNVIATIIFGSRCTDEEAKVGGREQTDQLFLI